MGKKDDAMKLDKSGRKMSLNTTRVATPNDPKLSDGGGWRGPCMAGGKAAAEARAVTAVAVRCSAWLGRVRSVIAWRKSFVELGLHAQKEHRVPF